MENANHPFTHEFLMPLHSLSFGGVWQGQALQLVAGFPPPHPEHETARIPR